MAIPRLGPKPRPTLGTSVLDQCAHEFLLEPHLLQGVLWDPDHSQELSALPGQQLPIPKPFHTHYFRGKVGRALCRCEADVQRGEVLCPRSVVEPGRDPKPVSIYLLVDYESLKGTGHCMDTQ